MAQFKGCCSTIPVFVDVCPKLLQAETVKKPLHKIMWSMEFQIHSTYLTFLHDRPSPSMKGWHWVKLALNNISLLRALLKTTSAHDTAGSLRKSVTLQDKALSVPFPYVVFIDYSILRLDFKMPQAQQEGLSVPCSWNNFKSCTVDTSLSS